MSDRAFSLRLLSEEEPTGARVESYRRLADVFHEVLAEQSLDALLDRIADALAELVPHDSLTIYEADEPRRLLVPVWARDKWADKILADTCPFGVGLTGWGVEHREPVRTNQAHLDPRTATVAGTPADEPEAMITIPLIARDSIKGALNVYRLGEEARFDDDEFELAKRFGDAAALALDNAQIRARLEHQAQTDSLTGLYNHRAFHERLRRALASASRSHEALSVLMLDIDDFKRVNDVFGHGAGDEILRSLAETLKDTVRNTDVVYRLGGEEFAIVIASRSPESAVSSSVSRKRSSIRPDASRSPSAWRAGPSTP
jgi:diguanylate cyclase (GGDEF)-like protein